MCCAMWLYSLWTNDAIWHHRSWSSLAQVTINTGSTVRYNTVNFLKKIFTKDTPCEVWGVFVDLASDILPEFLQSFMQYLIILDQVITALDFTSYLEAPSHYLNWYWLITCVNPQKSEHIWLGFQLKSTIDSYNFKTAKLLIFVKSIPVYFILCQFLLWGENDRHRVMHICISTQYHHWLR